MKLIIKLNNKNEVNYIFNENEDNKMIIKYIKLIKESLIEDCREVLGIDYNKL